MAKIDRVQDLPEWFDLEKYRGCEEFGAIEWFEQLSCRQDMLFGNPDYPDQRGTFNGEPAGEQIKANWRRMWRAVLAQTVAELRADPLGYPRRYGHEEPELRAAEIVANPSSRPVSGVTFGWVKLEAQRALDFPGIFADWLDRDEALESQADGWNMIHEAIGHDQDLLARLHGPSPITDEMLKRMTGAHRQTAPAGYYGMAYPNEVPVTIAAPHALARVDLSAPDSVLMEGFEVWLAEARAARGIDRDRRFHRPNFGNWVRYGLLPYLDLLIWSMETDTEITWDVMAAVCRPHAVGGGEPMRKTVGLLAGNLMRDLSELKALAALEAATGEPA